MPFPIMQFVVMTLLTAGSMAANRLLRKDKSSQPNDGYSWRPQTTQRSNIPIEYAIGMVPVQGNVFSSYTQVANVESSIPAHILLLWGIFTGTNRQVTASRQVINVRVGLADGPVQGLVAGKSRFNGRLLDDLTGVTTYERLGTDIQAATGMGDRLEVAFDDEVDEGDAVIVQMTTSDYSNCALVIESPEGLGHYNNNGSIGVQSMRVKIEIREVDGVWHTLFDHYLFGSTIGPVRWCFEADGVYDGGTPFTVVEGAQHEWRITCLDRESGSANRGLLTGGTTQAIYPDSHAFPGQAYVELRALATESFNTDVEFNGILQGQILESIAGGSFSWSDNPARAMQFIFTRPLLHGDGSGTPFAVDYYRGYDPANLHAAEFAALESWCDELVPDGNGGTQKRFRFNGRFSTQGECWEQAAKIGAMCRANPWYDGMQIRVWIDKPATPTHLFCVANILADSYSEQSIDTRTRPSEIETEIWVDSSDYESVPILVVDERASVPHIERMDGMGTTNVCQLTQLCSFLFDKGRNTHLRYTWSMETCGLDVEPGHVGYLQHDANGLGRGGWVVSAAGSQVVVDASVTTVPATTYKLIVQTIDAAGKHVTAYTVASVAGDGITVTLTSPLSYVPARGDCYIIAAEADLELVRITAVSWQPDGKVAIQAEQYSEAAYERDDGDADYDTSVYLTGAAGSRKPWKPVTREDLLLTSGADDNLDTITVGGLVFAGNGTTTVSWAVQAADDYGWIRLAGQSYPIQASAVGTTNRYIYFDPAAADPTILQTTDLLTDLAGEAYYLLCENVAGVPYPRGGILVSLGDVKVDGMDANADNTAAHAGDIFRPPSATPPENPQTGWIWPDNSASPTMIKRYDGSQWVVIGVDLQGWLSTVDPTQFDGSHISPGSITTGALAALAVQAQNIWVESLSAICSYIGTLVGGDITGVTLTGGMLRTATSGRRIQIDSEGITLITSDTAGKYGRAKYSQGKYGSGRLARVGNTASGIPFEVASEQSVADFRYVNRASNPSGPAKVGDTAVVGGKLKICTVAGTPGTWTVAGTQS